MHHYRAFSRVERGQRHQQAGIVCQDFALASDAAPDCSVIVAADGHGGGDYFRSDRGARFIVQAAAAALMEFASEITAAQLRDLGERRTLLRALCDGIMSRWHEAIEADLFDDPVAESRMERVSAAARVQYLSGQNIERAYGTTMIAAVVTEDYWLGLQLGDGRCVAVRTDGGCEQPIPWDERCQNNLTTSISDEAVLEEFRHCFSEQPPAAIFLCTDGVEGAYPDLDGLYGLCQGLCSVYLNDGRQGLERITADALPKLSSRGTGDDVTIAGLFCTDKLMPVAEVLHAEEALRRASAFWDQASREVKEFEHEYAQMKLSLEQSRAQVSSLESQVAADEQACDAVREQIRLLQERLEQKEEELNVLRAKRNEAQQCTEENEAEEALMEAERKNLQQRMEAAAAKVEGFMDAAEQARRLAAEQRRTQGTAAEQSAACGEDFTEPWAFVNRRIEKEIDS